MQHWIWLGLYTQNAQIYVLLVHICDNQWADGLLSGFMTIGMPDYTSRPEDFNTLLKCRKDACEALGMHEDELEVSMGMSSDFEQAVCICLCCP